MMKKSSLLTMMDLTYATKKAFEGVINNLEEDI